MLSPIGILVIADWKHVRCERDARRWLAPGAHSDCMQRASVCQTEEGERFRVTSELGNRAAVIRACGPRADC